MEDLVFKIWEIKTHFIHRWLEKLCMKMEKWAQRMRMLSAGKTRRMSIRVFAASL